MLVRLRYIFIVVFLAFLAGSKVSAQSETMVIGTVTSSVDGSPMAGVYVFSFKMIGEAKYEFKRAEMMYETDYIPESAFKDIRTAMDGTYEVTLPVNGALIFYKHPFKPVMVNVKGKSKIDVVIEATQTITESVKVDSLDRKDSVIKKPTAIGNKYSAVKPYYFDVERLGEVEGIGRTNARLISQMFVVTGDEADTVQYMSPRVYDGEQFHATQALWHKDTLYSIASKMPRLENARDSINFNIDFEAPDNGSYLCKARIWIEDYLRTYYADTVYLLSTDRVSRPFQFLQYSFDECLLDPKDHKKPPRKEQISTPKNMKLQFKIGKAELDKSDAATMASLDSLKDEISEICRDPSSKLREISFEGYSSPDGPFAKNRELSQLRTQTVQNEVMSVVPRDQLPMIYRTSKGHVAPWTDVAVLLEADSLKAEAAQIRRIAEENPTSIDRQGYHIRQLPFYSRLIVPRLPELRSVRCRHLAEVTRFLTPEEILHKYRTDKDYRTGKKILTLNEYWHLFQLITDKDELEGLYKRALISSQRAERRLWVLPANNLAATYIARKQIDTTLLKPFLKDGRPVNYSEMEFDTGLRIEYNHPEVIANQAQMFMLADNYERAVQLTAKVKYKYPMLDAICRLLGEYIVDLSAEKETIELINSSSPRNKVVMDFYLSKIDSTTVSILNTLPKDDPVTDYLKVQRLCLQYGNDAVVMRSRDFNRDEDPDLILPTDRRIPPATPEEIEAMKREIQTKQEDIQLDKDLGDMELLASDEKKLKELQQLLSEMEQGKETIEKVECSVYEAAYQYLKQCFEKDPKFKTTARGDYDVNEELLNDVLGIKMRK